MGERVYVALGSNLGDRAAHLAYARERLAALPRTRVLKQSRVEETAPLGPVPQGPYLNQMVLLETALEPAELLGHLHAIEAARGREHPGPGHRALRRPGRARSGAHHPPSRVAEPRLLAPRDRGARRVARNVSLPPWLTNPRPSPCTRS